jgi:hypothetical protein
MTADQNVIRPGTLEWLAWIEYLTRIGGKDDLLAKMHRAAAAGRAMKVPRTWPTPEAEQAAKEGAGEAKPQTPLSPGAAWLGYFGTVEAPLIDARGALAKAGVRPSDKLLNLTTKEDGPPRRETRWAADDFLRKAPALKPGQHVWLEFERNGELKTETAICRGTLIGPPEPLNEQDCVPFLQSDSVTRRQLLVWWQTQHPDAGPELAEEALKAMSPKELKGAVLKMDMDATRPLGTQHRVSYDPFQSLFKVR